MRIFAGHKSEGARSCVLIMTTGFGHLPSALRQKMADLDKRRATMQTFVEELVINEISKSAAEISLLLVVRCWCEWLQRHRRPSVTFRSVCS
jgi:hypothetical protein